jgi:hypothetical protein
MGSTPRAVRFEPAVLERLRRYVRAHPGLSASRRFPRDRRFAGSLVVALDKLLAAGQLPGPDEVGWLAQ